MIINSAFKYKNNNKINIKIHNFNKNNNSNNNFIRLLKIIIIISTHYKFENLYEINNIEKYNIIINLLKYCKIIFEYFNFYL